MSLNTLMLFEKWHDRVISSGVDLEVQFRCLRRTITDITVAYVSDESERKFLRRIIEL